MSRDNLNQVVREIADALRPELILDKATGVATADEKKVEDVFAKFLPAELTMDSVRAVQDYTLNIAAGVTLAHGEAQRDHLKEHADLSSGSLKVKLGHSSIETSYERERSGVAMGKPWKKQGIANTDVLLGTGRKNGDYKAVVKYLGEDAASVFAN